MEVTRVKKRRKIIIAANLFGGISLLLSLFLLKMGPDNTTAVPVSSSNAVIINTKPSPLPTEELAPPAQIPGENSLWASPRAMGLVKISEIVPGIKIDLKYAGTDNFMGINLYGEGADAWLQPEAAEKLKAAQDKLRVTHPELVLIIYDAARPQSIQKRMWNVVKGTPNQAYVASPGSISLHAFGAAVDLGIWNVKLNAPLDMGTPFDSFTKESQPALEAQMLSLGRLTKAQIDNRNLLRGVMKSASFHGISNEWWHFNAFTREETKKRFKPIP